MDIDVNRYLQNWEILQIFSLRKSNSLHVNINNIFMKNNFSKKKVRWVTLFYIFVDPLTSGLIEDSLIFKPASALSIVISYFGWSIGRILEKGGPEGPSE